MHLDGHVGVITSSTCPPILSFSPLTSTVLNVDRSTLQVQNGEVLPVVGGKAALRADSSEAHYLSDTSQHATDRPKDLRGQPDEQQQEEQ